MRKYNLRKRPAEVRIEHAIQKKMRLKSDSEDSDEEYEPVEDLEEEETEDESYNEESNEESEDDASEDESEDDTSEDESEDIDVADLGYSYRAGGEPLEPSENIDLSQDITDHIMNKYPGLGVSEKALKRTVKKSMKRGRDHVFGDSSGTEPKDEWKNGLNKKTVKELEPELKRLRLDITNDEPTMEKILRARIPIEDKKKALQLFEIYQESDPGKEMIALGEEIRGILSIEHEIGDDIERYEAEEAKLRKMVGNRDAYLKQQILNLEASDEVKSRIYEMYLDLLSRPETDSEYHSIKDKIVWAVSIPHNKMLIPNDSLRDMYDRLDKKLYGLKSVKERLVEIYNNRRSNPKTQSMLALKGPPGVGKTLLAKALAESFEPNLPFDHISLGGMDDPSIFRGSDNSWVGATPSIILQILRRMKYNNGIVFLDEIDKLGDPERPNRGSRVQYALLHIMDYTNNQEFQDVFLSEFTHDFSNIWWVLGMNNDSWIDPTLRSRLDIVTVEPYKAFEKVEIIRQFMLPEITRDIGLPDKSLNITDHACNCLLNLLTSQMSKGDLRPLKRELHRIISRIHMIYQNSSAKDSEKIKLSYSLSKFDGFPHTITSTDITRLWTHPTINTDYLAMYG